MPRNSISDEDQRLFRAAVADARRLSSRSLHSSSKPKPKPSARFTRAAEREVLSDSLSGLPNPSEPLLGDGLFYSKAGVQERVLRKLRRGHYRISAELDLHGLRSEEARLALAEFLRDARGGRTRCVRIIHGKGYRSGPHGPVLKHKLNGWLRQRDEVMAFCSARPVDGGTGAVYVLLNGR